MNHKPWPLQFRDAVLIPQETKAHGRLLCNMEGNMKRPQAVKFLVVNPMTSDDEMQSHEVAAMIGLPSLSATDILVRFACVALADSLS
eukprot:6480694-Amphidinium_carterae.1